MKVKKAAKEIDVDDFLSGGFQAVQPDSDVSSQEAEDDEKDDDPAHNGDDSDLGSDAEELLEAAEDDSESDSEGLTHCLSRCPCFAPALSQLGLKYKIWDSLALSTSGCACASPPTASQSSHPQLFPTSTLRKGLDGAVQVTWKQIQSRRKTSSTSLTLPPTRPSWRP